jgi:hypothetical protein
MARRKEKQFEITMYKLLVVFAVSLFVTMLFGTSIGKEIGENRALESLDIPSYCYVKHGDTNKLICSEVTDFTADEMCDLLSTSAKRKFKVLFIN